MSTDTQEITTLREKHLDLTSVTLKYSHNFDDKLRHLELVLAQSTPDEDADSFENLVLPLKILLVENMYSFSPLSFIDKNPNRSTII